MYCRASFSLLASHILVTVKGACRVSHSTATPIKLLFIIIITYSQCLDLKANEGRVIRHVKPSRCGEIFRTVFPDEVLIFVEQHLDNCEHCTSHITLMPTEELFYGLCKQNRTGRKIAPKVFLLIYIFCGQYI